MAFSAIKSSFLVLTIISICSIAQAEPTTIQDKLAKLESAAGGRIGVCAVNTANDRQIQYRANERFPMGCTSKVIGVSAILKKSMKDPTLLQQRVMFTKGDIVTWSPIAEKHLADGMTIAELGAAAISYSDNTAMNLLVKNLGGLQKMTAFARTLNDYSFRQDNGWPDSAKSGGPNDLNDSSVPAAMEKTLQRLAFGNTLAAPQRELLLTWLKNNTTGDARIRAGVPKGWVVGDKTGTGVYYGTTNDIGIVWPPKGAPIVLAIYFTQHAKNAVKREDVVAQATRMLLEEFAKTDHQN
jgi:beta-lactamase class A